MRQLHPTIQAIVRGHESLKAWAVAAVLEADARECLAAVHLAAHLHRMPYDMYLASPQWRSLRVHVSGLHGDACQECGGTRGGLEIHHLTYKRRGWESLDDLMCLCANHHAAKHPAKMPKQPHPLAFVDAVVNAMDLRMRGATVPQQTTRARLAAETLRRLGGGA